MLTGELGEHMKTAPSAVIPKRHGNLVAGAAVKSPRSAEKTSSSPQNNGFHAIDTVGTATSHKTSKLSAETSNSSVSGLKKPIAQSTSSKSRLPPLLYRSANIFYLGETSRVQGRESFLYYNNIAEDFLNPNKKFLEITCDRKSVTFIFKRSPEDPGKVVVASPAERKELARFVKDVAELGASRRGPTWPNEKNMRERKTEVDFASLIEGRP
ncbi:MAG: hypothetical protein H7Z43_07580 [Clostridia bacterium]|nr:hypothetical protein [Deltaproteobacteria bacterium]